MSATSQHKGPFSITPDPYVAPPTGYLKNQFRPTRGDIHVFENWFSKSEKAGFDDPLMPEFDNAKKISAYEDWESKALSVNDNFYQTKRFFLWEVDRQKKIFTSELPKLLEGEVKKTIKLALVAMRAPYIHLGGGPLEDKKGYTASYDPRTKMFKLSSERQFYYYAQYEHNILSVAFGKREWEHFANIKVGEEPKLPDNIMDILNRVDPFDPKRRKIHQNYLLTLIPEKINGENLSLNQLAKVLHKDFNIKSTFPTRSKLSIQARNSRWVLMRRNVVQRTRKKDYKTQCNIILSQGKDYDLPTALDAVVSILMEFLRNKSAQPLFPGIGTTYRFTLCRESVVVGREKKRVNLVVGGFDGETINIGTRQRREAHGAAPAIVLTPTKYRKQPESGSSKVLQLPEKYFEVPDSAFGAQKWVQYFEIYPTSQAKLPDNINQILDSYCPLSGNFFNKKKVKDTHSLIFIPNSVKLSWSRDATDFNLSNLQNFIKSSQGHKTNIPKPTCCKINDPLINKSPQKGYWILIPNEPIIKGDSYKAFNKAIHKTELLGYKYDLPSVLELSTSMIARYTETGIPPFSLEKGDGGFNLSCKDAYTGAGSLQSRDLNF